MIVCTVDGILAYQVYDESIGTEQVSNFITNVLKPKLPKDICAMLDTATNQNNEQVRECLDNAFDGLYCYLSPYSPQYAPAEGVISNV